MDALGEQSLCSGPDASTTIVPLLDSILAVDGLDYGSYSRTGGSIEVSVMLGDDNLDEKPSFVPPCDFFVKIV